MAAAAAVGRRVVAHGSTTAHTAAAASLPFLRRAWQPRLHAARGALAAPPLAAQLQHRLFTARGDKPDGPLSVVKSDAASVAEDAGAKGGVRELGAQPQHARGPGNALVDSKSEGEVESIETILIRSHRQELVERLGPKVERYLPTEDPNAFLLPDSRLEPTERWWQKVFVAVPWMVFACMLAAPLLLVRTNLPWLQKRAEEDRRAAETRAASLATGRVPEFAIVSFSQMPDVLERPFPTLLLLFDPATFASKLFLPALRDLEKVFRAAGLQVSVAALDLTASPAPPASFLWEYPGAMAPHLQLILPRARDGEAGVVDYDGRWTAVGLTEAARGLAGPRAPDLPMEELARIDALLEALRETLFEFLFVDTRRGTGGGAGRPAWWRRVTGFGTKSAEAAEATRQAREKETRAEAEQNLDFTAGLDRALASCQEALQKLQLDP